ncbi:hypothetical protein B0H16DRAFT_1523230 [Mycena metata]|uniref:BTB domain-containing protein n=1 Tax=Mycena metata TaxID=1033252 RepID=A0AAD7JJJ5_9AGAR|nr:hypothetical protein B0H16DRAFT_1523230 [Mycena metata]
MSQPELNQTDGLWFPADAIILRAEENIFRVPKSILGARSSVFQAIFEIPQAGSNSVETEEEDEKIDGIPVVRLHDSAADVTAFLRAIFDSSYFMPPPEDIDFHELLGILGLSHKYDVGYLYKRAISHLETVYPLERSGLLTIDSNNLKYRSGSVDFDLAAIPVLHRVGATWLLPTAYYNVGTFWDETLEVSGKLWPQFPSEMKLTCIRLHVKHVQATSRFHRIFARRLSTCTSPQLCNARRLEILRNEDEEVDHDPLGVWSAFGTRGLEGALCDHCLYRLKTDWEVTLLDIWNELPGNCGVPEWPVLLEQRRIALE